MDTYIHTYIRVESGYVWGKGMAKDKTAAFFQEVTEKLGAIGFTQKHEPSGFRAIGTGPTLMRGIESLYCHPMELTGYLREDSREAILLALTDAKTFRIRAVDEYERKLDVSPNQYREMLMSHRGEIERRLFEKLKTPTKTKAYRADAVYSVETKDLVNPLDVSDAPYSKNEFFGVKSAVCMEAVAALISAGLVVTIQHGGETFYRSKNKTEMARMTKKARAGGSKTIPLEIDHAT